MKGDRRPVFDLSEKYAISVITKRKNYIFIHQRAAKKKSPRDVGARAVNFSNEGFGFVTNGRDFTMLYLSGNLSHKKNKK